MWAKSRLQIAPAMDAIDAVFAKAWGLEATSGATQTIGTDEVNEALLDPLPRECSRSDVLNLESLSVSIWVSDEHEESFSNRPHEPQAFTTDPRDACLMPRATTVGQSFVQPGANGYATGGPAPVARQIRFEWSSSTRRFQKKRHALTRGASTLWVPLHRSKHMILAISLLIALAFVFVKLGALSVWVTVLNAALLGLGAFAAVIAIVFAWDVWRRRRDAISCTIARANSKRG